MQNCAHFLCFTTLNEVVISTTIWHLYVCYFKGLGQLTSEQLLFSGHRSSEVNSAGHGQKT